MGRFMRSMRWSDRTQNSLDTYEIVLKRLSLDFAHYSDINQFSVEDVRDFLDEHWGDSAPATRRNRLAIVKSFFRFCVEERGGRPEREVPSRRMPDGYNAREIEGSIDAVERVDSRGHVEERLRPSAPATDAAVLEVPGRETVCGEVKAEAVHKRAVVLLAPVPAMHDDGNRMRSGARRHEELAHLARTAAVRVNQAVHRTSRLRRDPNEALDHRGHLLVRVELVEVPRADRHPDVDVRPQRKQASRVVAASDLREQHEQGHVAAL